MSLFQRPSLAHYSSSRSRNFYHAERRCSSATTVTQNDDRETSIILSYNSDSTSAGVEAFEALGYASQALTGY